MICKVCGTLHATCGPRVAVTPVDERVRQVKEGGMTLQKYEIRVGNRRGEQTAVVKLTDAEAKRLGAKPVKAATKAKATPANKAASPAATKDAAPAAPASDEK